MIYGRSDSTLNRGGVRMGTSECYRVVEAFPEVVDSLVIDGKKCEVPVEKILTGTTPEQAVSQDTPRNPDALKPFLGLGAS